MESYITYKILLIIFLFTTSGFFASAESSLFSLTTLHLHKIKEENTSLYNYIKNIIQFPKRLLITIIIGNEVINILISSLMAATFIYLFKDEGKWLAILITTPMLLIFSETIPKTLAKINPIKTASFICPFITIIYKVTGPIVNLFDFISSRIILLFGLEGKETCHLLGNEFRTFIDMGLEEGILEQSQRDLICRIFELNGKSVEDIMTPRVDMFCLSIDLSMINLKNEILRYAYSRIPIYKNKPDNIIGILYAKDLLFNLSQNKKNQEIISLLRKPYFIPIERTVENLLKDFQKKKMHLAIVVDEYGNVIGLVTMEDILEVLFGDIYDERDTRESLYHLVDDNTILVSGRMSVDYFNQLVGTSISSKNFDTISGYIFHLFGRLPIKGESILAKNCIFRVEKMGKAKILRLRVIKQRDNNIE